MQAMKMIAGLAAMAAGGAAQAAERGFSVAGFDRVRAAGPFDVVVRVGGPVSVRAVGTQAALDHVEVVSEGGQLRVGTVKGGWSGWSNDLGKVVVTVTVPSLRGISLAGSGDVHVDRARATAFEASVAGSGDLVIGTVQAERLGLSVAGSGDLTVTGRTGDVTASVAGSGDINGQGLSAATADIQVAGSGDVALAASRTAKVALVGSGDVSVTGGAKCSVSKRGSGDVSCG